MTAILYQTTNLLNGKIYIGVDGKCDPEYLGSGKLMLRAIKKHGRENFHRKDLAAFDTKTEAFEAEKEIVTPEWCESPDNYNLDGGGRGPSYHSRATRKKIAQANTGRKYPNRKPQTFEHRANIAKALTGITRSPETKRKISIAKRIRDEKSRLNRQ